MRNKFFCFILIFCVMICMSSASANLIIDVKNALTLMSYGEFSEAADVLQISDVDTLRSLAQEKMSELSEICVQTDVAVAYKQDEIWMIAVPIEEPTYDTVPAFVVTTTDKLTVDDYGVLDWYTVTEQVNISDEVIWDQEYIPGTPYIVADD